MSLLNCEKHGHSHPAVACPQCVREMDPNSYESLRAALSAERTARRVLREALVAARKWWGEPVCKAVQAGQDRHEVYDEATGHALVCCCGEEDLLTQIDAALAAEPGEGPATPEARSKAAMLAAACHGCGGVRDWILNGHVQAFCWRCEGAFHGVRCARLTPPEGHPRAAEGAHLPHFRSGRTGPYCLATGEPPRPCECFPSRAAEVKNE